MFVIAESINVTHPAVGVALRGRGKAPLQSLAKRRVTAGADALNVNLGPARHDCVAASSRFSRSPPSTTATSLD